MKLVSKTRTHQLTYIAIMSAVTIVLSILANFFPLSSLLLIIFLPFVAALVAIVCDLKYFPIYLVASVLLSVIVDMPNFLNIIFYLLPSLISGLVIGITYRIKTNGIHILVIVAITNLLCNYLVIPVLDKLYETNFIQYALGFVGLENHTYSTDIFMLFLYTIALIQASITYMIVNEEIYIIRGELKEHYSFNSNYVMLVLCITNIILPFFHTGLSLIVIATLLIYTIYQLENAKYVSIKQFSILLGGTIFLTIIAFVISELHSLKFLGLYLILPVLFVVITNFLWEYIFTRRRLNG
jgi:hypothetical protein